MVNITTTYYNDCNLNLGIAGCAKLFDPVVDNMGRKYFELSIEHQAESCIGFTVVRYQSQKRWH